MNYKKLITTLVAVAGAAVMASAAPRLMPLTLEEQAHYGATHCITVSAADMAAVIASNTAWAVTNTVTKPCSVKFVAYLLNQPFNNTKAYDTNGVATTTNSITLSCGDGNSSTKWISAVQAAYDATPTITASFGTDYTVTCYATNGAPGTVTSPILNAQTSDVSLIVSVGAPGTGATLSALTKGQARFFFKIFGTGWQVQ